MKRFPGESPGSCSAVAHDGYVHAVATDPVCSNGIGEQNRNTLQELDRVLAEAGSGKIGLIQATAYLSDIGNKAEMDVEWGD